jgi:hypothetical protein
MTLFDVGLVVWIATVTITTYIGVPALVRRLSDPHARGSLGALAVSLIVTACVGMTLLSLISLVNAITVVMLHAAWAIAAFLWAHRSVGTAARRLLRLVARLGEPLDIGARLRRLDASVVETVARVTRPHLAACSLIACTLLVARVLPALAEARLFHPAAYQQLFLVRQMLDGTLTHVASPIIGLMAATATLSAVDAADIVRFVPPLLVCVLTATLMWTAVRVSGRFDVALVASLSWLLAGSGLAAATPWSDALARQHAAAGVHLLVSLALWSVGRAVKQPIRLSAVLPMQLPQPSGAGAWGLIAMLAGSSIVPPHVVVEHDSTARQSLRILREQRGARWTIVGRPMPIVRGLSSVDDLTFAVFAACASGTAVVGGCGDPAAPTYVFVQKRPFDPAEADAEQQGLMTAERVARGMAGARIYHDDETLRVYELPPRQVVRRVSRR